MVVMLGWGSAMPIYKAFVLGKDGLAAAPPTEIVADDDAEAMSKASVLTDAGEVEIWEGTRLVVRIDRRA
jgi:hypothetical protein